MFPSDNDLNFSDMRELADICDNLTASEFAVIVSEKTGDISEAIALADIRYKQQIDAAIEKLLGG